MSRIYTFTITFLLAALAATGANRRLSYDELASASDKVLLGRVGVKRSHYGEGSRIYTDVVVAPDVTIKGANEGAVVVQTLGGTVGDVTMSVSDGPALTEGDQVVVFLKREGDHFVVTGRSAGTIAASSSEAAAALNGALTHVERATGANQTNKRAVAHAYLHSATTAAVTSAAATQTGCYGTDGSKWATNSAQYKIGASIPSDWAPSIDASAGTWGNAGVAFRLVNDSTSANELSYLDLVAKYGASYSNTYAVTTTWSSRSTGRISMATIEINNKWTWSTAAGANMADVQNILTHEFGHWMRLLDIYSPSSCGEVTMWGSAALGETKKRTLEQADIDGFKSLYGAGSGGAAVGTPVLASPGNGATNVAASATLSWTAASNATSYDVYLGTTPAGAIAATVTGTSYQPGTLTAGTTYYWHVVARNSSGTATSATSSFSVANSSAASGPTLLTPADGATGVATVNIMQWTAVAGAVGYDLYVGTTSSPARIGSINATSVRVSGFQNGTVYYWTVVARLGSGGTASSVTASFRTVN